MTRRGLVAVFAIAIMLTGCDNFLSPDLSTSEKEREKEKEKHTRFIKVSGTISYTADGSPMPGVLVELWEEHGAWPDTRIDYTTTGEDGRYWLQAESYCPPIGSTDLYVEANLPRECNSFGFADNNVQCRSGVQIKNFKCSIWPGE